MKQSTFFGIDLHARQSWCHVRVGERVTFSGSAPNDCAAIDRVLACGPAPRVAAVEAGGNWPWLVYGLQERGVEVRLLHPPSVTPYRQTQAKTDKIDAALLCSLAAEPWRVKQAWICPDAWVGALLAWCKKARRAPVILDPSLDREAAHAIVNIWQEPKKRRLSTDC